MRETQSVETNDRINQDADENGLIPQDIATVEAEPEANYRSKFHREISH